VFRCNEEGRQANQERRRNCSDGICCDRSPGEPAGSDKNLLDATPGGTASFFGLSGAGGRFEHPIDGFFDDPADVLPVADSKPS